MALSPVRAALKHGAGRCVAGLGLLQRLHRGRVVLLAYHRVLPDAPPPLAEPGMYVTASAFRAQLRFLTTHYDVLSLEEWLEAWSGRPLPGRGRYCILTFDDGWRDTYEVAFPLLREFRVPATIFLATGFVGTRRWFWTEALTWLLLHADPARLPASLAVAPPGSPWQGLALLVGSGLPHDAPEILARILDGLKGFHPERLTAFSAELAEALGTPLPTERICMTWENAREMSRARISFGSHTVNHLILPGLPAPAVAHELEVSGATLDSHGLTTVPVFCYPNGAHDGQVKALVARAGYRAAVSTRHGAESLVPQDPFAIHRVGMHQDVGRTAPLLAWRLAAAPRAAAGAART